MSRAGASDADEEALETDVVVIGAGGCGLAATLAAAKGGARVICLEKAKKPLSNTARSGGMIPAAGTRLQREAGIDEAPEQLAEDIFHKNGHGSDREATLHLARTARELVEWLIDDVGVSLTFVGDFKYPGHTQCRMHAPPSRTGAALVADLRRAAEAEPTATLVTGSPATALSANARGEVTGVIVQEGPETRRIAARKVILACNGYGGNRSMLARYCPEIAGAMYFGGEGSTGEGIAWGLSLGGEVAFMDAYQGHASVASPHGVLITYAVIMEGGVQVNARGERFVDETRGYSENALQVLAQPGGVAVNVYDERIHQLAMQFEDYREAVGAGAVKRATREGDLARAFEIEPVSLSRTLAAYAASARGGAPDALGRVTCRALEGALYGVRVTGALFHTQGGLVVDRAARVVRKGGGVVPNLYAGGGVAAGISGHGPGGYLSGNGLLTALAYGMLAGRDAARAVRAMNEEAR